MSVEPQTTDGADEVPALNEKYALNTSVCYPHEIVYGMGGRGHFCAKCGEQAPEGWMLDEGN